MQLLPLSRSLLPSTQSRMICTNSKHDIIRPDHKQGKTETTHGRHALSRPLIKANTTNLTPTRVRKGRRRQTLLELYSGENSDEGRKLMSKCVSREVVLVYENMQRSDLIRGDSVLSGPCLFSFRCMTTQGKLFYMQIDMIIQC